MWIKGQLTNYLQIEMYVTSSMFFKIGLASMIRYIHIDPQKCCGIKPSFENRHYIRRVIPFYSKMLFAKKLTVYQNSYLY